MNPRNKRLLEHLVSCDKVLINELRSIIGALNPAQNVFELRQDGWDIHTGRITIKDRDKQPCHPGYYWLEAPEKLRAIEHLKKSERAAVTAPPVSDNPEVYSPELSDTNDDIIGGENDNLL